MYTSLTLKPAKVDLVIYHGKCADGFTSALAVYKYFKEFNGVNENGNVVEYFPASFNQSPPNVENKNVLICDFSYKKNILLQMISKAKSLAVIDHHESAQLELIDIPDEYKLFDMNHSGAYLTWKFFYPEPEVPLFIKYVEDNDIWLKQLPFTEEITCYTYSLPFEFEEYEKMLDDSYIETIAKVIGSGMKRQNDIYIKDAMSHCVKRFVKIGEEYSIVAYVNSTVLKSEIGNKVLSKYPYADFSAVYSMDDNFTTFSLRSLDDKTNVSQIATKFGGGGHRNASGISVYNSSLLPVYHIDNGAMYKFLESDFLLPYTNTEVIKVSSCYMNPKILGKYLMQVVQEKISKTETRPLQKCCSVLRTKCNNSTYYQMFKFLIIESQIIGSTKYEYNIFYTDISNITQNIMDVLNKIKDFTIYESENRIKFTETLSHATKILDVFVK